MSALRLTSTRYSTQYLLNQISHENNVTAETAHIQNSLPNLDSKNLKFEADETLSNLLLDGEHQSEISEQNDSARLTSVKTVASLDHSIRVHDLHAANNETNATKHIPRISSNFDGTNEEFVGAAYGNGQISVYDSNQSSFQINCTRNWENLSSTIDASTSRKEFWSDLKCENSPSTSQSIEKICTKSEQYAQNDIAMSRKTKNSDADYDYSDLGPETNVNAINDIATLPVKNLSYVFYKDETDACNDENQQLDKGLNVLGHRHINESTDFNLSVNDVTNEPIADSNLRARNEDDDPYSDNGTSAVGPRNEIEKRTFGKANNPMVSKHAVIEGVNSHFMSL
ncbi:hypothetical protein K0M31_002286 [Melipona bicolor]|uniref:Uncharacterized protein n=1 Tax=Melipona bicolor TaxID=60889 RepID=A0AA40KZ20_9HYME|nr:hypothetical protein K0M31_002286 [Melipona bicolor]